MLSYNPFYNPNNNTAYKNPGIENIWDSHKINADKTEVPMGREVEGGFMFGNACTPMADSCQCMAKTTTML